MTPKQFDKAQARYDRMRERLDDAQQELVTCDTLLGEARAESKISTWRNRLQDWLYSDMGTAWRMEFHKRREARRINLTIA